jgi:hypothetical protein
MVMRKSLGQVEGFVGVDISESWLDVHLLPSGERARFSRDRRGIARLVRWLVGKGRLLVVVEATGGLKRGLRVALAQAGIALAVVNPRQIRDLARAADRLAKTDRLDAWVLALYGERLRPATKCARCLHGDLGGHPAHPNSAHLLRPPRRRRQSQEACAHRRHGKLVVILNLRDSTPWRAPQSA